jgi:hypothetical protein
LRRSFWLAVRRPFSIVKASGDAHEGLDLAVVRDVGVDLVDRGLDVGAGRVAGDQEGQVRAGVADQHALRGGGAGVEELLLDRLRGDVVARLGDEDVLDAADDLEVAGAAQLALIAGVEPAVAIASAVASGRFQ